MSFDVAVLGGGAAGLFAAIHAARRGRRVVVIEHAEKVGKKILISGGGRCNFTNRKVSAANFLSANVHFCKSALSRYTPEDFIALVERHGIAYHEKTLGQLFCDHSARQIVDMLVNELRAAGAHIWSGVAITDVQKRDRFLVSTSRGELDVDSVVVATGGLSIPKMGATGFGYELARRFGLDLVPTEPALVPFKGADWGDLSGVSFPARVALGKVTFEEAVLVTHTGLSGPAILQISSYWKPGESIRIDCLPHQPMQLLDKKRLVKNVLGELLPKRFAEWKAGALAEKTVGACSAAELQALEASLRHWIYMPSGTGGYEKAEVTRGGVSTHALNQKTLEANAVKGLFFAGEVVDVTGWLGGYNFQWAWASGFSVGNSC